MNIQKLCLLLACAFTGFNAFAAPNALNSAPAMNAGSAPPAMTMSSAPGQTAPHEDALLNAAHEEKQKDDFLSEIVQDEQKMAQIAKEFDERLKKIETALSGVCNTAPHEKGAGLNMSIGAGAKPAGPATMGMPLHTAELPSGNLPSSMTSPVGAVNQSAFNPSAAPAPMPQK